MQSPKKFDFWKFATFFGSLKRYFNVIFSLNMTAHLGEMIYLYWLYDSFLPKFCSILIYCKYKWSKLAFLLYQIAESFWILHMKIGHQWSQKIHLFWSYGNFGHMGIDIRKKWCLDDLHTSKRLDTS